MECLRYELEYRPFLGSLFGEGRSGGFGSLAVRGPYFVRGCRNGANKKAPAQQGLFHLLQKADL